MPFCGPGDNVRAAGFAVVRRRAAPLPNAVKDLCLYRPVVVEAVEMWITRQVDENNGFPLMCLCGWRDGEVLVSAACHGFYTDMQSGFYRSSVGNSISGLLSVS